MTSEADARRYLLGTLGEDERDRFEREYFVQGDAIDRVSAAEEDLIEDYLDARLSSEEREQFDAYYLASPLHQTRLETIRRLSGRMAVVAPASGMATVWRRRRWVALGAAAVVLLAAGVWLAGERESRSRNAPQSTTAARPVAPTRPPGEPTAKQPVEPRSRVFAVELPPLALRSGGESPRLLVPPDVDTVELRLQQDPEVRVGGGTTVTVATVSGEEIWRGSGTDDGEAVRVRVPASKLPADDYIVTLHRREPIRYFLRVRTN